MKNCNLKDGHIYTLIGTSVMAMTTQRIVLVHVDGDEATYQKIAKGAGSRKHFLVVNGDEMVFEGIDIPFLSDMEAVKQGLISSFRGDNMLNLHSRVTIEESRVFIEEKNLNPLVDLSKIRIKGVPVFPEFCPEVLNQN